MKIDPTLLKKEEQVTLRLRELYRRYGYTQYKMNKFEEYSLYARNRNFLISDSVITFTDTAGRLMALKPDVTLSIVKNSQTDTESVQKVYYDENVYRVSGNTRNFREIRQVGLECLGNTDIYTIGEVLSLAAESLGEITPSYILDVSDLDLLSAVLDGLALSPAARRELLTYVEQKDLHDAAALCRREGADFAPLERLMSFGGTPSEALPALHALRSDPEWTARVDRFAAILAPLPEERVRVDFSVLNDMNYYSGIVFRGFAEGIPEGILSGGQYDPLMQKMGRGCGAIGFAVYLDRLEALAAPLKDYDVSAVLLYSEQAEAPAVRRAVAQLTEGGESVFAARSLPEKLKYRRLLQLTESGVTLLEDHA